MIINIILRGLKRILFGETDRFTTRKGSSTFNGSSWTELYREICEYPMKLISIEILTEKDINGEFRICVDGEPIFPFNSANKIESCVTKNFILPINIAAGSLMCVEIRSGIQDKSVCILSELAVVEIL